MKWMFSSDTCRRTSLVNMMVMQTTKSHRTLKKSFSCTRRTVFKNNSAAIRLSWNDLFLIFLILFFYFWIPNLIGLSLWRLLSLGVSRKEYSVKVLEWFHYERIQQADWWERIHHKWIEFQFLVFFDRYHEKSNNVICRDD